MIIPFRVKGGLAQKMLAMFSNGEQGVYFDPNNSATLFEDAAGTTPTSLERPVGLMRDLSGRGNHATSSSTARPTLTRRVNSLSNTEDFSNSVWVKSGSITPSVAAPTFTTYTGIDPKGNTRTIYRFTFPNISTSNGYSILFQISSLAEQASVQYTNSIYIKRVSGGTQLPISLESSTTAPTSGGYSTSVLTVTDSWAQYSATSTLSGTPSGNLTTIIGPDGRIASHLNLGAITVDVWGADLRPANFGVNLPAYQRVGNTSVNAADYDTTGFPAWLRCSGGQSMVTPSINFTGTSKATVWAGVRKSGSTPYEILCELGPDNQPGGLVWCVNGASTASTYLANYRTPTASASFPDGGLNQTYIGALKYDRDGSTGALSELSFRKNGAVVAGTQEGANSDSTGNFGNYPLYLFARNQASLFFNGLAGPIIVRGAQSSAVEIANAENWINAQQKVY